MRKMNVRELNKDKHSVLCFNESKRFDLTDSRFKDSFVIICDNETNELFKVVTPVIQYKSVCNKEYDMGDIDNLNKINLDFTNRHELVNYINKFQESKLRQMIFDIYEYKLFSNGSCAIRFCDTVMRLTNLNKIITVSGEYGRRVREFIDTDKIVYFQEFVDFNTEASKVLDTDYCIECINTACVKYKKYLDALYKMYQADSPFAGTYKVSKNKFVDNETNNFDIIKVSFQMVSDKSKVYEFIKKHSEFREEIIRPIFNHHARRYANFMQLYDVVLTNANELVFSFCFKEKAEKLLSSESK